MSSETELPNGGKRAECDCCGEIEDVWNYEEHGGWDICEECIGNCFPYSEAWGYSRSIGYCNR